MNEEEDKIFKPDPEKFGNDKALYDRMSLMYERCGVTEKMIADGKKDAELSKSNPAAYKQLMESRHGKDWDKNDDADIPMRRVCTDFVKQTWETVGKSSFRFEKGGDEHEK